MRILFPAPKSEPARRLERAEVDEVLERLFAAPIVDGEQMPTQGKTRIDSGEMRLALAVLEDALRRVLSHFRSPIQDQRVGAREALSWIQCEDDAAPFAFIRICQLFDLDPDWIRQKVRSRTGLARDARSLTEQAA